MNKTLEKHERICPETNQQCQTGYCRNTCSFQEIEKHCNGKCDKSKSIFDQNCPVHGNPFNIPTYAASLPSKPVGDVEDKRIKIFQAINSFNVGMAEYFAQHNYRMMYDLWNRFTDYLQELLRSGYAAAPQKGVEKYSEDAPDKAYLAFNKHFPTGSGEFMTTWINGYVAAIRDAENESPSPSEAGDAVEIIDGYTQLAIDKRSLPKDGQHVKFMTENEEFHEGYFVGGDDIFHVTDSKFFFKWHVQQWKVI